MKDIMIVAGDVLVWGRLNESETAEKIWQALPFEGTAALWGDEIYFEIPVVAPQAPDARVDVGVGTLAYWPIGHALCIFFGPTPASVDEQPRAYSPVNVVGQLFGDVQALRRVRHGDRVRVAPAEAK